MMNLTRWVVATISALALALLTLPVDLPWPHLDAAEPETYSCPANAKPANLNFTLKDFSNKNVKLSAFRGKVILLDFWATWCGPCKIEIPWFIEFQNKYGKDGLQVVGVVFEDPNAGKVRSFVDQNKMNYVVLDGNERTDIEDAYGPMFGLPVTVVISRDGKVCAKHVGLSKKESFEGMIKTLLTSS